MSSDFKVDIRQKERRKKTETDDIEALFSDSRPKII